MEGKSGEVYALPRLQGWMSERHKKVKTLYQKTPPDVWTEHVMAVKQAMEQSMPEDCDFDYVLFNRYRNGDDKIGFHRDDEAEGVSAKGIPKSFIGSISIGATRTFILRNNHKTKDSEGRMRQAKLEFPMTSGYLIIMCGETQNNWYHAVPAEPEIKEARINLTFRVA
ncbi:hypothetical protein SAMD00019534_121570 [Acytostelium subglobosum LB1]|uniref:hypothetical protein n=1 Tax=Acytostelium subglobosum LB1 TaxID=1410327 RepID=UPI00064512C7|nr:hypothetical protein SAMD00019534_121570 [Acytostelium subglobosum LB1]GAM28981.1 hypothetical protein SAMD00019534_121570 [Acytostelium subglobosum LB1]|eukprot:XP_012747987.1 hypothetical protein SAMD00019534_121570 [Acytostelium subglobosum LB1]